MKEQTCSRRDTINQEAGGNQGSTALVRLPGMDGTWEANLLGMQSVVMTPARGRHAGADFQTDVLVDNRVRVE